MTNALESATSQLPYGTLGQVIAESASVRGHLDTLTLQASSGRIADSYAGLGAGASTSLALNAAIGNQTTWQSNIDAVSGPMQVAQTALTQINSVASSFYAQTDNLNGLDASSVNTIAASARAALTQVAGLLDSTDGDTYVFGGQDSANPPVPDPDGILGSGFATQIATAVAGLNTNGAAATIATTLGVAGSNATGTSPFTATLSQPATSLASLRTTVNVGAGQNVPTGILASANGDVASTGSSTTGSYTRDILRALATLGSLSSAQSGTADFTALVADTRTSLGGAISALNDDAGVMGNRQTQLTTTKAQLGETTTAMQTQLSSAQDVDMTKTLSDLTATQTQLQASYQLIAGMQGLSLVKYLAAG